MKQQMLKAALLLLTLTGAAMANAQPFTLNTAYKYPSTYTAGFSRYMSSNYEPVDVNGDYGTGYHYCIGLDASTNHMYVEQKNASSGAVLNYQTLDVQPNVNTGYSSKPDYAFKMCVDPNNNLLYVVGCSQSTSSTPQIPFLIQYDIASGTPVLVQAIDLTLAGSSGAAMDVTVDNSGNVYVVSNDDYGGGQYDVFKYNSSLTLLSSFYSKSGQGLTQNCSSSAFGIRMGIKIDNNTNNLYVIGQMPVGSNDVGFLANFNINLTYNTYINRSTSYSNVFSCLDIDPTTNNIAVIGRDNLVRTTWDVYSAGLSTAGPSGASSVNGNAGTDAEEPFGFLIDHNGNYILMEYWISGTTTNDYYYVTYIDKSNPLKWDVYYGSNAFGFAYGGSGTSGVNLQSMHKDNNGKIVVCGADLTNGYAITASLNNPTMASGWSDYENKHTAVTNVTAANGFSVYPNPAQNELNISLPADGKYTCRIMNSLGQLVASQNISDGKQAAQINITSLAAGQYYVQLQQENKTIGTTAFVKE